MRTRIRRHDVGRAALSLLSALLGAAVFSSCGARTEITPRDFGDPLEGGAIQGCLGDLDCGNVDPCAPSHCVNGTCVTPPRIVCDDGDPCTDDTCAPGTGACVFTSLTFDEDGDGHKGPRPGFKTTDPGACGDDCDDTSALAYPGAIEKCDGVDNDCNGIVDDGALYEPLGGAPVLVSTGVDEAELGGIAYGSTDFGITFGGKSTSWHNDFAAVKETGVITVAANALTHENTDAFTGPIVWTGKEYGIAWEDRRDQDFEIYFNRLDGKGQKLARDLRVTNAPKFSLRPDAVWDGAEFVVVWSDRRDGDGNGRIFGQRIDEKGALVGDNVGLTEDAEDADAPRLARGETELGLVFNEVSPTGRQLSFRAVSPDLGTVSAPVVLGGGGAASSAIVWSRDRYVVVWDESAATPGPSIRGAAVAPDGTVLISERDVTTPAPFARSEALLALGDRLLLLWAEYRNGTYAIFAKTIAPDLTELTAPVQVTTDSSDDVGPSVAIGPSGTVTVAYTGLGTGSFQVYVTRLGCSGGTPPPLGR